MNMELSLNILKIREFGRTLGRSPHFAGKIEKSQLVLSDFAKATAL